MRQTVHLLGETLSYARWGDGPPILLLCRPNEYQDWLPVVAQASEHLCIYLMVVCQDHRPELIQEFCSIQGLRQAHLVFSASTAAFAFQVTGRFPRLVNSLVLSARGSEAARDTDAANALVDSIGRRPVLPFSW